MASEDDLRSALSSAHEHLRFGGAAVFAPDHIAETFRATTDCGGYGGPGRAMRYLEWLWDPDPSDNTYLQDFAYLLKEDDETVRVEYDRHTMGLFGREVWLSMLRDVGFDPKAVVFDHSEIPPGSHEVFVAAKRGQGS